jgi:hypothetical protein
MANFHVIAGASETLEFSIVRKIGLGARDHHSDALSAVPRRRRPR